MLFFGRRFRFLSLDLGVDGIINRVLLMSLLLFGIFLSDLILIFIFLIHFLLFEGLLNIYIDGLR